MSILRTMAAAGLLWALCRADEPAVKEAIKGAEGAAPTSGVAEEPAEESKDVTPDSALIEPVKEIKGITPTHTAFRAGKATDPLVIKSAEGAARYFSKADLGKIRNTIDWDKQMLLLFAWRGSGSDRLRFDVAESSPEQVMFTFRRGRTRDLRSYVRLFALRSDVQWILDSRVRGVKLPRKEGGKPSAETDKK